MDVCVLDFVQIFDFECKSSRSGDGFSCMWRLDLGKMFESGKMVVNLKVHIFS